MGIQRSLRSEKAADATQCAAMRLTAPGGIQRHKAQLVDARTHKARGEPVAGGGQD